MAYNYNPFKENRTEQMRDLWKYYVPYPGLDSTPKPIVVQGGRGSGKTMFFQCNSWRQQLLKIHKERQPINDIFEEIGFVGIYYRVDTTFVSAMFGKEEENWNNTFETYFSICILQEILDFIIEMGKEYLLIESEVRKFILDFPKRFYPKSQVDTLEQFRQESSLYLDAIEDKINGFCSDDLATMRGVNAHRLITDICIACTKIFNREILFKVFIDEYETLQDNQQKIINTLIKHSTPPVVFNIGLRLQGMKTKETISFTETIETPHDYEEILLGINQATYNSLLPQICSKRIAHAKALQQLPQDAPEDIRFYLGEYRVDDELEKIFSSSMRAPHIKALQETIQQIGEELNVNSEELSRYKIALCDEAPLINSRLHYALLSKSTVYTPTLEKLYYEYSHGTKQYIEWLHTRKNGLVFMLCKEYKREKMYYGFDVFAALSSNIVRYFLELCEQAFKLALFEDYQWDKAISPEIQTSAAKYVSEYKVTDISSYEPYGKELRVFTQYLGQIFYRLHTQDKNTVGEPEPNHFSTKDLSLPVETKRYMASAVMWNVLQMVEPTKRKDSRLSPETVDYYLNKIYAPYFNISYRNQRKIHLNHTILEKLFSGDEDVAKSGLREYFKEEQCMDIGNVNPDTAWPSPQLSLFEEGEGK